MSRDWSTGRGRRWGLASLVLIMVLGLVGRAPSVAGPLPEKDPPFETMSLPPEALSWTSDPVGAAGKARHPNLDAAMAGLAAAAEDSLQAALKLAESRALRLSGDRVHVQIVTDASRLDGAVEAVVEAGGEVTVTSNDTTLIQGWLPIAALESVAADSHVHLIRRPDELVLLETMEAGSATTEGLAAINGPAWHSAGHTGAGVKVGIIDGGFQGYTSLLGTDLPASVTVRNFVDGETDGEVDGTTPHGTACAEVIHDIVPDASLYLAKTSTSLDVQEAATWLINQDVDVISTSIGWYNLTPGDGTGPFADLVGSARDAGILWVTAAGNEREGHWGGPYYDPESTGYHHFSNEQNINFFGPGDGTPYAIPEGFLFQVHMRWDDWTNVDQDYDLYLLRWNGSGWDVITGSDNVQDGSAGQTPAESAVAVTSGSSTAYGFVIQRKSSNRAVNFEVFAPKIARLDELLYARSLVNLADAPLAMTTAALDISAPYPQEPYSSEGPTNGSGGAETGGFTKPDISGYANVATESYDASNPFNGTSAATPHVAGAAALVASAYPAYTPAELQSFLEGRAVDMGASGQDTVYGYGRLYLGDPPGTTAGKTWDGSAGTDWHNAANWTPSGVPTVEDDVTVPAVANEPVISASDAAANNLTVEAGATLHLTTRILSVEGTLTNNGTLRQTAEVTAGDVAHLLYITNQAGTQTKYQGVEFTPEQASGAPSRDSEVSSRKEANAPRLAGLINSLGALVERGRTFSARILGLREGDAAQQVPVDHRGLSTLSEQASEPVELRADSLPARPHSANAPTSPQAPDASLSMVLDDGGHETAWGVNNTTSETAHQFIWFNRFTPQAAEYPFALNEIRVLFDGYGGGANVNIGDAIDLVVYQDSDGDPTNGAEWVATINETIQAVDGTTWSVYSLSSPVQLDGPGDVLIAVINRYTVSGVSPMTYPATIDTTMGQDRSWMGYWTGAPPDPAILPPDTSLTLMTGTEAGNWLIRGYGETIEQTPTPTPTSTATPVSTETSTPEPTSTPTPVPSLGQVTVSVSGNQFCTGRLTGVGRCYDIDPVNPMVATVRFYFQEAQRNGQALEDLKIWHNTGEWVEVPGPYVHGGGGDAQYVEAQGVRDFSPFALDAGDGSSTIFLPLLLKRYPVVPSTPALNAINNGDGDGNYTVSWSASDTADTYTLQEDDNANFSSPTTAYAGAATSTDLGGRDVGTYYYRVRASNPGATSGWSNIQSVEVTVPPPPCPQAGAWSGTTSQGRAISFEVVHSPACQIAAESLSISIRDSCGFGTTTEFFSSFSIADDHFDTGSGSVQVAGDFSSRTEADGTFSLSMAHPYEPWTTCTASGTWTAAP